MKNVSVKIPALPPTTYDIRIGAGLLGQLGELVKSVATSPSLGIVTDSRVAGHYLATARVYLEAAGFRVIAHVMPAGEEHKTLATVSAAVDTFLNARVERATPIIALGGGVVGDLGGYVAASLLRGVPFIQVPTTLLAAVDASVGGKVGVDHPTGKNLIGAFHQPRMVITDIATFATLPPREIRAGLAECIKHGVIRDEELFSFIEENLIAILANNAEAMAELVAWNVSIKAAVVAEDPFEHGIRALLNFGHTFGHAIETVMGYSGILHGEAVALGMVAAGRMAAATGPFPQRDLDRLTDLISAAGLPTRQPGLDVEKTFHAMFSDKKVRGGKLRFILPSRIGAAEVVQGLPEAAIRDALASLAR